MENKKSISKYLLFDTPEKSCFVCTSDNTHYIATVNMLMFGAPCIKECRFEAKSIEDAKTSALAFARECEEEYRARYEEMKKRLMTKILMHSFPPRGRA